jgi:hypothetical protein
MALSIKNLHHPLPGTQTKTIVTFGCSYLMCYSCLQCLLIDIELTIYACSGRGLSSSWTLMIHTLTTMVLPPRHLARTTCLQRRWIAPPLDRVWPRPPSIGRRSGGSGYNAVAVAGSPHRRQAPWAAAATIHACGEGGHRPQTSRSRGAFVY